MTKNIPVNRYPQAYDALYVLMPDGSYQQVNAQGGGGPGGSVTWNDIQDKPDSVNVDTRDRANHLGTQLASTISDLSDLMAEKVDVVVGKGLSDTNYTQAEKTKLAGIAPQATANATDASLRDRATHTGTQTASTIVDLPDVLATKVDVVAGKVLSDSNFTQAEKDKLAGLEDGHFKGVHVGLAGLTAAHPSGDAGDYAVVDDGATLTWYQWSVADTDWTPRTGESTEITPAQVKQYYEQNPDTNVFTDDEKARLADLGATGRFTMRRIGTWNAETNTPTLINGTGNPGDYYVVTVAGTQSFGSFTYGFAQYDWVLYSGGTWQRLATNPSASTWDGIAGKPILTNTVNGKSGTVVLTAEDIGALPDTYTPPAYTPPAYQAIHIQEQKPNGTIGGATVAGSWATRSLNTVKTNTITGATFASNAITLPAGTYKVNATGCTFFAGSNRIRLTTNNVSILQGFSSWSSNNNINNYTTLQGVFTLATSQTIRLQHRVSYGHAEGWGKAAAYDGEPEVYAELFIEKVG